MQRGRSGACAGSSPRSSRREPASDDDVLARLAEFYGRIGESDQSTKVLQRLAQVAPNDPSHLVDLGDRYFQSGNVPQAVATWKRILTTVTPRSRALAALGDVYPRSRHVDRGAGRAQGSGAARAQQPDLQAGRWRRPTSAITTTPSALQGVGGAVAEGQAGSDAGPHAAARIAHAASSPCGRSSTRWRRRWGRSPGGGLPVTEQARPRVGADAGRGAAAAASSWPRAEDTLAQGAGEGARRHRQPTWRSSVRMYRTTRSSRRSACWRSWSWSTPSGRASCTSGWRSTRCRSTSDRRRGEVRGARGGAESGRRRGAPAARRNVPAAARTPERGGQGVPRGHREERAALSGVLRAGRAAHGEGDAGRHRRGGSTVPTRPPLGLPTRSWWRGRRGRRCRSTWGAESSSRWRAICCP